MNETTIPQLPQIAVIGDRQLPFEDEILKYLEQFHTSKPNKEKFHYFWQTVSPFSQWHRCTFTSPVKVWGDNPELRNTYHGQLQFFSAEQYMMFQKAILFSDAESAAKILQTKNVKQQKMLGKRVKGFNEETWKTYRAMIVAQGNMAKFTHNPDLKKALIATSGRTLVEAAPNDRIWGIGLSEDHPAAKHRHSWKGLNLLGALLTWLRIHITGSFQ